MRCDEGSFPWRNDSRGIDSPRAAHTNRLAQPSPHPRHALFPPNCPTGLHVMGIVRILPILWVDVRMAHPVLGSTMKFAFNEKRCQAGRSSSHSCWPRIGRITSMNSRTLCVSDRSSFSDILARLVHELMLIHDGVAPSVALDPTPPERWEDEEFIYLDADLHEDSGLYVDICIHSGRAFVRMARSSVGPMCPP